MEPQHLTYFKIENFKRFDSFEMSNLGQFNLIVGDNNVGKTSVLEALLFDEDLEQLMVNFLYTVAARKIFIPTFGQTVDPKFFESTEFWRNIFKRYNQPIVFQGATHNEALRYALDLSSYKELDEHLKQLSQSLSPSNHVTKWVSLINKGGIVKPQVQGAYFETSTINYLQQESPYIPVNLGYSQSLVDLFFQVANANKGVRRTIESFLGSFIPYLEEVRVHRINGVDVLSVSLSNSDELVPLTRYGDGTVKFVRFLIEVVLAKGKRLMVDEIGSGIHFTRLVDYWKTVIRLCDQYKVQLFATTHSLECQQAFVEALEDPEMQQYQKDARNISLIENKQGEVKAVTFDFEQLNSSLENGIETRGGKQKGLQVWK